MSSAAIQQKQLAASVGMTPDALSRALNGQRGFAAVELADMARVLDADIHELITGEPGPLRFTLSARHSFDHATGARSVDGAASDEPVLENIRLAYAQAGEIPPSRELPATPAAARELLGDGFVPDFVQRLEGLDVDVVVVGELSTAYTFLEGERSVIAIQATGNWFHQNWSLAHELGHLALGHRGVIVENGGDGRDEAAANAFAAELLLPEREMVAVDWRSISLPELADLVWETGISTGALRSRLDTLRLESSERVDVALELKTQTLLRKHWRATRAGDPITERTTAATARAFPAWLRAAHLDEIAAGRIGKGTLAWMLELDPELLQVDEPAPPDQISGADLEALLG